MKTPDPSDMMNLHGSSPAANDEVSLRNSLDRLASTAQGQPSKEETRWQPMEAERLDEQRLEDLSIEVYGY